MNRPSVWGIIAGSLFATLLIGALAARPAYAQLTPQQKQEVRQHYDRATRAYDVGKYQEAIEEYQKAYEIGADPSMLYNIAQAYRLSDQPAEALRMYKRYLQRAPTAKNREDVEHKIADLEKLVEERKKASVVPPPSPPSPVVVVPPPISPPPPAPIVTGPAPEPVPPPRAEPSSALKLAGWMLVGVGAAAAIGAGYEGYVAKQKADKVTEQSKADPPVMFDSAVEENGHRASTAAIVLGVGGAVVLAGGVVLLVIAGRTPAPVEAGTRTASASLNPWVGPGILGAGTTLHF